MTGRKQIAGAVGLCLLLGPPTSTLPLAADPGAVEIRGSVRNAADGAPVNGATVVAVHIDTKMVFRSSPTSDKGAFALPALPSGYFDLAVDTPTGLYLANRVFSAPAGEKSIVCFAVGPPRAEDTAWWSSSPNRRIPGLDRAPDGVARIVDCTGRAVATAGGKPAGTRTVARWVWPTVGAVGVVGLGLALSSGGGSSGDGSTSPAAR